ncbi:retrotransposon, unclassified [Olea europaea subsp. europaea]|uniref:Retrotransposon, unclassified n=1 Tax=Olea europaea subsp. europaea TaxID=158383 RepID=A0A8S0UKG3_OLEEU|nr:retrotransposon, unclassified [Olea europaea subsp. europaea]
MATFPGFTNPSSPPDGNPGYFPPLGNVGALYMATLSLPGLIVGLLVWLFSSSLVPTVSAVSSSVPPPEQRHVDPQVDLSPSMPTSTSTSSTSLGESLDSSTRVAKKKKKKTKKAKSAKGEVKSLVIATSTPSSSPEAEPPYAPPRKVKFPCRLCKEDHLLRDCPGIPMILDAWSHDPARPSSSPDDATLSVGKDKGNRKPPLPEPGCTQPVPDQSLVGKSVDSSSLPVDHSVLEERNSHVLLVSSDSPEPEDDSLIPTAPEDPLSVSLYSVISFDWSRLTTPRLPSHVPFWVTAYACNVALPGTLLDEGAYVSLMPAPTWKALGSPLLVPVAPNLTAFDGGTSQPLGILRKFPITLGGKTIYIDVSVTQGSLDFSLLLGHDYVYAMGALVSSLFRVVCFPHDGRIVMINQLSFVRPQAPPAQLSIPPSFLPPVASALPQINYVATSPMPRSRDAAIMHSVLGALGPDFQDVALPFGTAFLAAPTSYSL